MKKIKDLVCQIDEELEGAKEYAERYLDLRSSGENQFANKFKGMAEDELRHSGIIHDYAVMEIEKLKTVYTPPVSMEEEWNKAHKEYIELTAWIRQMLSM